MSSLPAQHPEDHCYDVAIVGGGMVGATFACALAGTGLRIALIDSEHRPDDSPSAPSAAGIPPLFDARVSAISPASRNILEAVGAWEAIAGQRCCAYTDMHVWEADGTGSVHFQAGDIHADELGYIIENSVLLRALRQRLQQWGNVSLIGGRVNGLRPALINAETSEQGLDVFLAEGSRISSRLLVAADGANSAVRRLAGFQVNERDYDHHAIVTTVRTSLPHRNTAIQRFMDDGVLAFLPLPDNEPGPEDGSQQHCSVVWSVVPARGAELQAMSDADFLVALQAGIENRLGTIEWADRRVSFPLRQRHASTYVKNHIALIGDAAHSIHPLAGMGVNLGLLDAWSLAGQIQRALQQQRDFASLRILQRYQRERMGNNLAVMWLMDGFKRLFADQPLVLRWLRNTGMRGVDSMPVLKNQIMRQAMGISAHAEDPDSSSARLRR